MTQRLDDAGVEARVRSALQTLSDTYDGSGSSSVVQRSSAQRSRSVLSRALKVAALVVLGVVVAAGVWSSLRQVDDQPSTRPNDLGVPADAKRVPLRRVATPSEVFRGFLEESPYPRDEAFDPLSLDTESGAVVSIVRVTDRQTGLPADCLTIAQDSGVGFTCSQQGENQLPFAPRDRPADTIYYSWSKVPRGVAYVVFRSRSSTLWQRPVHKTVVLPVPDPNGGGTLRAYDSRGRRVGNEVTFSGLHIATTSP